MRDQFGPNGIVVDNALMYSIQRVYQASRAEMFRSFREEGVEVTPEQWLVMVRLWEEDGRTQTDLGSSTLRDRPTMSRILDSMERNELIVRRADPDQARIWRVFLTRRGRALEKKLVPRAKRLVEQMESGIPERDLNVTRATLRRMVENLGGQES